MNKFIEQLLSFIENPIHRWLKIEYFPDKEVIFYIYESEVPIYVHRDEDDNWVVEMVVEDEVATKFCKEMLKEIYCIMEYIENNLKYFVIEE